MVKVKPSAVLLPAESWKVNWVLNWLTLTGLVEKTVPASKLLNPRHARYAASWTRSSASAEFRVSRRAVP